MKYFYYIHSKIVKHLRICKLRSLNDCHCYFTVTYAPQLDSVPSKGTPWTSWYER